MVIRPGGWGAAGGGARAAAAAARQQAMSGWRMRSPQGRKAGVILQRPAAPHHPDPLLPSLHHPSGEKREKNKASSLEAPSLPGRGGWRAGREGVGGVREFFATFPTLSP